MIAKQFIRLFSSTADAAAKPAVVNKLLYRAKQRGFLELDLIVGLWAEKEVPKMSPAMMQSFSQVLDTENPDLFKWLTGQLPAPEPLSSNMAFVELRKHVDGQLAKHSDAKTTAKPGATWKRGWDDAWQKKSS